MNKDNYFKSKLWSEQFCMRRITNNDLVCKDCLYRYDDTEILGNTSRCEMYEECKPNDVIDGGPCDLYDKEESV